MTAYIIDGKQNDKDYNELVDSYSKMISAVSEGISSQEKIIKNVIEISQVEVIALQPKLTQNSSLHMEKATDYEKKDFESSEDTIYVVTSEDLYTEEQNMLLYSYQRLKEYVLSIMSNGDTTLQKIWKISIGKKQCIALEPALDGFELELVVK